MRKIFIIIAVCLAVVAAAGLWLLHAQQPTAGNFGPGFTGYSITRIYQYSPNPPPGVPVIPVSFGALTGNPGNPNEFIIGGNATGSGAAFYAVTATRDADQHITGFSGPARRLSGAPGLDGGAAFGPPSSSSPVLFYSIYSGSSGVDVGMVKAGSSSPNKTVNVIPETPGALAFVPTGFDGAGQLKILSYTGKFYTISYAPDGAGTFNLSNPVLSTTLQPPQPTEAFVYIRAGSAGFTEDAMLVAERQAGVIAAYDLDSNANPISATRRLFLIGPPLFMAPQGMFIDPLTGDLLLSTAANSSSAIYRVSGVGPIPTTITRAMVSPNAIPINTPTTISVTAIMGGTLPLPQNVTLVRLGTGGSSAVIGYLHDDGLAGDTVGGDHVWTTLVQLLETDPEPVTLQVSAVFAGLLHPVTSTPITLTVQGLMLSTVLSSTSQVVQGVVTSLNSYTAGLFIFTDLSVAVTRTIKGPTLPTSIVVKSLGGTVAAGTQPPPYGKRFDVGQQVVLFLDGPDSDNKYSIASGSMGIYRVQQAAGGQLVAIVDSGYDQMELAVPLDSSFQAFLTQSKESMLSLDSLIAQISGAP